MKITAGILLLLAAAACSPSVPSEPTWVDDVRPIMAANCIRCHSPPYIYGAPANFRLDRYGDDRFLQPDGEVPVHGAEYASVDGTLANTVEDGTMPPRFPLTGRQIDVLVAWHDASEPKGEPRADNHAPTLTLTDGPEVSPGRVGLSYEIEDADGDIVTGVIVADPGGGADPDPIIPTNELFVGRGTVRFSLPTGNYALAAELDDGNETVSVDVGEVTVP
jgi:hypothetical protein